MQSLARFKIREAVILQRLSAMIIVQCHVKCGYMYNVVVPRGYHIAFYVISLRWLGGYSEQPRSFIQNCAGHAANSVRTSFRDAAYYTTLITGRHVFVQTSGLHTMTAHETEVSFPKNNVTTCT